MAIINEELAKRSKENMSFGGYQTGSATSEYRQECVRVNALIESAKLKVSDQAKERLDNLYNWYCAKYAQWTNAHNTNGSNHVSVMISGSSNYNMRAHEKFLSRESKLWKEYDELKDIEYKISAIVAGDKIIKSGDVDAIDKLQAKIDKLEKLQETMKSANAIIRKKSLTDGQKIEKLIAMNYSELSASELLKPDFCGRIGFPSFRLTNNNATIRTAKQRLAKLTRERAKGNAEIVIETATTEESGIKIVDNVDAARLQIFFPGKPSAEVRAELKRNGFRWTPSIGAWQSYRSERANQVAQHIASNYKEAI